MTLKLGDVFIEDYLITHIYKKVWNGKTIVIKYDITNVFATCRGMIFKENGKEIYRGFSSKYQSVSDILLKLTKESLKI